MRPPRIKNFTLFILLSAALVSLSCGSDSASPPAVGPSTKVTSDDGLVTLEIPANAGVDTSTIHIRPRADLSGLPGAAFAYDLEPDGLTFAEPATFRWEGPLTAMGGSVTKPDISLADIPIIALRSHKGAADPSPEALTEQALNIDLDKESAVLQGKLRHFSGVVAEDPTTTATTPDHEKFAGHMAIGFMGVNNIAYGTNSAPVVGLRFWLTRQIGIDVELGVTTVGGTTRPAWPGRTLGQLRNPNDEVRFDPPATTGILTSSFEPQIQKLGTEIHFGFIGVPELSLQATIGIGLRAAAPCPAETVSPGVPDAGDILLGLMSGIERDATCAGRRKATDGSTWHSNGASSRVPELFTDIDATNWSFGIILMSTLASHYYFSVFHCGAGEMGFTVCPTPAALPQPGEFMMFRMILKENVPTADPANQFVYAFVMDGDADTANNYKAPSNYPKDFFDDTDRWYEGSYKPGSGWTLTAKDAHGPTPTAFATAARMVIKDNAIMLFVPASEVTNKKPRWRATSFRHKGDYGLNAPYDWSGDVVPPVGELMTP